MECSALIEVGNIMISTFINALSSLAGIDIELTVPAFTVDMQGAITPARMSPASRCPLPLGNIGQRNIESVHMNLKREGIRLLKEDVGGTVARTLLFDVSTGMGCVRCYGKPELII